MYLYVCYSKIIIIKKNTKRHETPVLENSIKIIYLDNDLIVLDKPCSVPVSVTGPTIRNQFVLLHNVLQPPLKKKKKLRM